MLETKFLMTGLRYCQYHIGDRFWMIVTYLLHSKSHEFMQSATHIITLSPSYSHHHIVVTNITDNYGNIVKRTAFCICCRSWPFWSDMQAVLLGLLLGLLFLGFLFQLIIQGCKILRQIIVNNEEQPSPGSPISVTTDIGAQSA